MHHQHRHHSAAAQPQPPRAAARLDALLLDADFDDFVDYHREAALSDALADYRNAI